MKKYSINVMFHLDIMQMAVFVYSKLSHEMKSVICIYKLSVARKIIFNRNVIVDVFIEVQIWYKEGLKVH